MNKKLDKKRNIDFYLLYTLVFLAVALALYLKFFANGKSLVWSHDGVPQHLNSLAYYGKYLRKVLHTLFIEHKLSLPLWDMHIGYGSDILTTLHYYVIGDPLTLLSVFVPASKTEALYAFLIFLRIYLAGIAFSRYSFYHKNSKQATFMGTMIYIFAGWTIYAAMKHPYFSNPMIYLPLILLGIDKNHMYLYGPLPLQDFQTFISFICWGSLWYFMRFSATLICLRTDPSKISGNGLAFLRYIP